jgi:hypothetical protein
MDYPCPHEAHHPKAKPVLFPDMIPIHIPMVMNFLPIQTPRDLSSLPRR